MAFKRMTSKKVVRIVGAKLDTYWSRSWPPSVKKQSVYTPETLYGI